MVGSSFSRISRASRALLLVAKGSATTLLRGFTTVRDVGGCIFSLATPTDVGVYDGPFMDRHRSGLAFSFLEAFAESKHPVGANGRSPFATPDRALPLVDAGRFDELVLVV